MSLFVSSFRWPQFHWQILHVGPDGCIRGSLEPYKFMKGPCIDDGQWHHIALSASSDWQCMFVDGHVVCSINFGIGHEPHRCVMQRHQPGVLNIMNHNFNTSHSVGIFTPKH